MRGFFKAYIRHCDIFLDFTFIYDTQVQFKTYYACSIFFNSQLRSANKYTLEENSRKHTNHVLLELNYHEECYFLLARGT